MTTLSELAGDYVLDPAHTRIGLVARHTMGTKVRGQFDEFEGGAHLAGDDQSRSSAVLTVQAKSLQTGNPQRDELVCGKFLGIDDHQTITFASTGMEWSDETNFKVTGDLSIRGVTKPVTVDFELTGAQGERIRCHGSATINRRDWGVNWNFATAIMVSPKVILEFDVAATRRL
ncbi:polyisoprenoid-binding protein YceI [Nocardia tenerifensis]|uniref:Polyisoprenoid-binding protein YceI n=1 Tax=Nocardia tenerifensis TaxID=228006 RepID=A0A318KRF0_9NOCA|nr:YceI family protein [Nocardia tenerifensis]PXX65517.1 polyisoprenoid-binding protein YceI [Nocardia tenerifensis]